jgi:hypothetical protein
VVARQHRASVIGRTVNGKLLLRFDDGEEAAAFEARWL